MSLQRDYVGIIPLAFALLCIPFDLGKPVSLANFFAAGFLFGTAAMFKPHLVIGLPVVFAAILVFRWGGKWNDSKDCFRCAAVCLVGFLIPVFAAAIWLWWNSALANFESIFFNYLPPHVWLTGAQENLSWSSRTFYLFEQTLQFGGYSPLVLCSLFAVYHVVSLAGSRRDQTLSAVAVFLCALSYVVYPALAGKFWDYHFMPLVYFLSLAASLCLFGNWSRTRVI